MGEGVKWAGNIGTAHTFTPFFFASQNPIWSGLWLGSA